MSDKEIIIPLEDLPKEWLFGLSKKIHESFIEDLKDQGVTVIPFGMELIEVDNER